MMQSSGLGLHRPRRPRRPRRNNLLPPGIFMDCRCDLLLLLVSWWWTSRGIPIILPFTAVADALYSSSSAPPPPSSSSSSSSSLSPSPTGGVSFLTNTGETVPSSVIDYAEKQNYHRFHHAAKNKHNFQQSSSRIRRQQQQHTTNIWEEGDVGDPLVWLDCLGTTRRNTNNATTTNKKHNHNNKIPATLSTSTTSTKTTNPFSVLSWNILSQSLYEKTNHHHHRNNNNSTTTTATAANGHKKNEDNDNRFFVLPWETRLEWILDTIINADADIVCLQEVENHRVFFNDLLPSMQRNGYDGVVQGGGGSGGDDDTTAAACVGNNHRVKEIKRRKSKGTRAHLVATFWKQERFQPVPIIQANNNNNNNNNNVGGHHQKNQQQQQQQLFAHMARGRTLTCMLQDTFLSSSAATSTTTSSTTPPPSPPLAPTVAVLNCHLEGHPRQYAARIRQLQHAMEDIQKRRVTATASGTSSTLNGLVIAGDFNCELQSSACSTYLRIGRVGRKGGLGGVHGTSALAVPPSILESEEAAEILNPIIEWGRALPNEDMENVTPHPFYRNSMVSAYPPRLGKRDPRSHFTYCANPNRPVAGLDQIWYSGFSLTRLALRKPFPTDTIRKNILRTGIPTARRTTINNHNANVYQQQQQEKHPSDHLPIGTVLDWNKADNDEDDDDDDENKDVVVAAKIRELLMPLESSGVHKKAKSPIMAFSELDMLLVTCPYDNEEQRLEIESIVDTVVDVPSNPKQKPSKQQLKQLSRMRERKKVLLRSATEPAREILQRILKLKKQVAVY